MQIFPNVYEIKSRFGDRHIQQYLFVGDTVVLLDAGIIGTPEAAIFPYMEKIGVSPRRLSMVIAMHADSDHHGGLPAIKDASSSTLLACHEGDRELIEDPEVLYRDRYNFLAEDHGLGFGRDGMVYSPRQCKIDERLSANQVLKIGPDWNLRVWHVPGHSEGHLAIYDENNHAAFTSDAVQAGGYPTVTGGTAFGPTYYQVNAYLATIEFLEKQPIEHMFTGHWPSVHQDETKKFLSKSRQFVESADSNIIEYLKQHRRGATQKTLLNEVGPKLGNWPSDAAIFLQFAMNGHLERLQQRGIIRSSPSRPREYSLV
jgi:glyoxylase-like metal-dependent hydrolase (beta-lactamase superfamily II)